MTGLKASRTRIKPGTKQRETRISFRLTAPTRVVFVVRGPAPSCDVVGRFSVRGRAGTNQVRFTGRIGRKTLEPGTYRLTARPANRARQTRPIVLIVGTGPRERLHCPSPDRTALFGAAADFGTGFTLPGATTEGAQRGKKDEKKARGVLPAISKRIRELRKALPPRPEVPRPGMPGAGDSPPILIGLAALALLALSALAILVFVIRFIRGPHTKSA